MWRFGCIAALIALAASSADAGTSSGLRGIVMRGPELPVCIVGQPCDEPAANVLLVFLRDGKPVATVRTGRDGRYRVALGPGIYRVRTLPRPSIGRGIEPQRARAPRARFARADFSIDTGIR
jgi:hypothetical protein